MFIVLWAGWPAFLFGEVNLRNVIAWFLRIQNQSISFFWLTIRIKIWFFPSNHFLDFNVGQMILKGFGVENEVITS